VKRKRIALSMKGEGTVSHRQTQGDIKNKKPKEAEYDPNDMKSALNALKSKFGK
jgi:hypothetical protein